MLPRYGLIYSSWAYSFKFFDFAELSSYCRLLENFLPEYIDSLPEHVYWHPEI
jgi:hypothetical protein